MVSVVLPLLIARRNGQVRLDERRALVAYGMEQPIFASFSMELELG